MLKKGSKLYSILTGTCPKCQNENMYVNKNPYVITETMKMHERCGYCGTRYKMEPNFFFGAMYVSYGLAVAESMIAFAICFLLLDLSIGQSFVVILVSLFLLMPLITRLSRNIYINMFMSYDKSLDSKAKND